ncbi:MAG: hypothetical protein JW780_06295 [Clostridiales bacterium]|nr:hypothetical protein [Clostridiales bacterium]
MIKLRKMPGRHSGTGRAGGSRSGGMLILVLVITAVGLILITSAMSITIATRNRFYHDSQISQAKLTVTSAANSVVDSVLKTQELSDAMIESWADANKTVILRTGDGYDFDAGINSNLSQSVAPGVGGSSGSSSYTTATFGWDGDDLVIDFATHIDATGTGATQDLKVTLEKIPPVVQPDGFGAMFTLGGDDSTNTFNNIVVGSTSSYDPSQVSSNYIILDGDMDVGTGTIEIYADAIYKDVVTTGAGNSYKGNIIFWGDSAGIHKNLGGAGIVADEHMLFLGETPGVASVFWDDSGAATLTSSPAGGVAATKGQYYINTTMKKDTWGDYILGEPFYIDSNVVFYDYTNWFDSYGAVVNMSGDVRFSPENTDLADVITATGKPNGAFDASSIKPVVTEYTTDLQKIANIERELPTTAEAKTLAQYSTVTDIIANSTKITNLTSNQTFTGSSYYIDASATNILTGDLIFDLTNNDITLYIINSSSALPFYVGPVASETGSIQFENGSANWGKIVLLENGYMVVGKNNYDSWKGIISVPHSGTRTKAIAGSKPCVYIIGFGNNTLKAEQKAIVDAYIGLYGENGYFWADNGPFIYGRIEAELYSSNNSYFYLDYCPAPNDPVGGSADVPLTTNYRVVSYLYS